MSILLRIGFKLLVIGVAAATFAGWCNSRADAQSTVPAPDTMEIIWASAYWQIYDSGQSATNFAVLLQYNIDYDDTLPAQTLDQIIGFQLEYIDANNNVRPIMIVQPFPYNHNGYGQGVVGFYVPDDFEGLTNVDNTTSIRVSVFFFPGYVAEGTSSVTLPAPWRPAGSFPADVAQRLRLIDVSTQWTAIELLDTGDKLTGSGEVYAINSIPYLKTFAPDIFSGRLDYPELNREDIGESYQEDIDAAAAAEGSASWASQFNALADWVGQPVIMVTTTITVIISLIAAYFVQRMSGSPLVSMPVIALGVGGGALIGFVSLTFIGVIALFGILTLAFVLVLKRAG